MPKYAIAVYRKKRYERKFKKMDVSCITTFITDARRVNRSNLRDEVSLRKPQIKIFIFDIFVYKTEPPFTGKSRSICMKN